MRMGSIAVLMAVSMTGACGGRTTNPGTPPDDARESRGGDGASIGTPPSAPLVTGGSGCDESAGDIAAKPIVPSGTLTIPTTHPRLWWTPERLERAKKWYAKNAKSWSPKGSPYYGDDYLDFAFVYLMSGDKKAGRRAVDWALSVKLDPRHPGNDARWYGEAAILIFDWCHDLMTAAERATMIENWNQWLEEFNGHSWGGLHMPRNNYFWGFLRNDLVWGIATHGENPRAQSFLDHALNERWKGAFLPYAADGGVGGVPTEGTQYGQYPLYYSVAGFATAACMGRNLYNETAFFRDAVYWAIYNTPGGPTVRADTGGKASYDMFPYADDEFWHSYPSAQRTEIGDFMTIAAMTWSDRPVGKYARLYLDRVKPNRRAFIRASDPGGDPGVKLADLPLDHFAPGAGYLWARTGWGKDDMTVLVQGSAKREAHEHYDAGQFQIWRGGRWLTREVVSYTHQIVGRAGGARVDAGEGLGHNLLVFGGRGQVWPEYRDGPPAVTRLMSTAQFVYTAIELTQSYKSKIRPQVHNPYVKSHVREVVFLRELEALVVLDRFEVPDVPAPPTGGTWKATAAADIPVTFVTHFEAKPTGPTDSRVVHTAGDQALQVATLYPEPSMKTVPTVPTVRRTMRVLDEEAQVNGRPGNPANMFRLEVEVKGVRQGYFVHLVQARDKSAANATAVLKDTGSSFEIVVKHPSKGGATVVFDKGMASSGGSVNGVPLSADVQPLPPMP